MEKMRIVVTGGAGLVGSHLCLRLLEQGHQVTCVDNLISGSQQGLKSLVGNSSFEMIRHNVVIPYHVDADQIYSLASPSSPGYFMSNPVETLKINLLGTINSLEIARRMGAPVLLASSGDVYGSSRFPIQNEGMWGSVNPLSSRSAIEEGKRAAESLMKAYHTEYRVNTKIARLFNVYGPQVAMSDGRVLPHFISNALTNRDIVIYGNGAQTRCFCYVDDAVEALIRLMNATPDSFVSPVNVGSSHEIAILDLAQKIILMTGSRSKILHMSAANDDPRHQTPDLSHARQILAWEPTTSLDVGLMRTIEYIESMIKQEDMVQPSMSWVEMS